MIEHFEIQMDDLLGSFEDKWNEAMIEFDDDKEELINFLINECDSLKITLNFIKDRL